MVTQGRVYTSRWRSSSATGRYSGRSLALATSLYGVARAARSFPLLSRALARVFLLGRRWRRYDIA